MAIFLEICTFDPPKSKILLGIEIWPLKSEIVSGTPYSKNFWSLLTTMAFKKQEDGTYKSIKDDSASHRLS